MLRRTDFPTGDFLSRSPGAALDAKRRRRGVGRRIVPAVGRRSLGRLTLRAALGSLGLALALGVVIGRLTLSGGAGPPTEVRITGAGHLGDLPAGLLLGAAGISADPEAIRERFLAAGVSEEVRVERALSGGIRVEVREKQAVALLDSDPPQALSGDGTVLGPATPADFAWAGAPDLVVVRGLPEGPDFPRAAALSGRLAAALRSRPELDRLVSELSVAGGPHRIELVLRPGALRVLLSEETFLDRFELVAGLIPELTERWPGLSRIDARVPDRLLLRKTPPEGSDSIAEPEGGTPS